MDSVTIQQIMVIARQESVELKHYYVGVEHLFLALTRLKGGVTAELLEQKGLLGYFLDRIAREAYGHGDEQRHWVDFLNTPRAEHVLNVVEEAIANGANPEDRALLLAILEEGDSLPIRILQELGADIEALHDGAETWTGGRVIPPGVPIEIEDESISLDADQVTVLREMFSDAGRIFVKHALTDGYSGAAVLLVQPVRHGLKHAPVVVKLDDRQAIQYEKLRYDQWVKDILPPTSARIIDEPTLPADSPIGGIKYTFVRQAGADAPLNLRQYAAARGIKNMAPFLRQSLYDAYRQYWWGQGQTYHFQVWQEYELLLPPALILQLLSPEAATATLRTLHPKGSWSYKGGVTVGETVILENFVVQKIRRDQDSLVLSAGAQSEASARASRVEFQGVDLDTEPYFRGQTIKKLVGRVLRTRDDILLEQVQRLEPNFDVLAEFLPGVPGGVTLPNPLHFYTRLLERWIDGLLSPIHGDLHTGNILMGPAGDAWLIDFEYTRQGHALFDWAVLETSLIIDLLVPLLGESWDACWDAIAVVDYLNRQGKAPDDVPPEIAEALEPIREVRRIARELLAPGAMWSEYFVALALCAIRVPSWVARPRTARRLMFLMSALYMEAARLQDSLEPDTNTINKTATDLRRLNS